MEQLSIFNLKDEERAVLNKRYTRQERRFLWKEAGKYARCFPTHRILYDHFKKEYFHFKLKKERQFCTQNRSRIG